MAANYGLMRLFWNFGSTKRLFVLVGLTFSLFCQGQSEFEFHLQSIDATQPLFTLEDGSNPNRAFVDYIIENRLENKTDKQYIANRAFLDPFDHYSCNSNLITISDTLKNGEYCSIRIKIGSFNPSEHQVKKHPERKAVIEEIDGQTPYGAFYMLPETEIQEVKISIDGNEIKIPKEAYSNFYDLYTCEGYHFHRKIEAYSSISGEYIYLYIYGGNAADAYFTKLIFDKEKYISKIVADYFSLSSHGSFREDFVGF